MMHVWQLFFVAFISFIGSFPTVALAESKITKIGVMLPLSGETMRSGRELQRGLELIARERDSLRYFVFEDIGNSDPAKLQAAADRLLQTGVSIVLLARTDDALAVYSLFAERQVPLVVLLDSNDQVQGESPILYSSGYSTEYAASLIARYTRYTRQARRVIVIADSTRSSMTAAAAFEDVLRADPTILVTREDYATVLASGASFTARLSDDTVDAVYAPLTASKVRQVFDLFPSGATSPVLLTGDYVDRDALTNPEFGTSGIFVTLPWIDGEGTLGASYRETYEGEPIDLSVASLAYETGGLVLTAVQEAESLQVPIVSRLDPLWPANRSAQKPARLYEAHGTVIQEVVVVEPQSESSLQQTTAPSQLESTPEQLIVVGVGEESPQSIPGAQSLDPASPEEQQPNPEVSPLSQPLPPVETPLVVEEPAGVPSAAPTAENEGGQGEEAPVVTFQPASIEPSEASVSEPASSDDSSSAGVDVTIAQDSSSQQDPTPAVADGEAPQAPESAQTDNAAPSIVNNGDAASGDPTGGNSFDNLSDQGF